jgi:type I restriction enzyme S subunit
MDEQNGLQELPKGWISIQVGEIVDKPSLTGIKLPQKNYLAEGQFPVIDQGQDFIGGYSNDESLKVDTDLPVIIFGDHTKAIKFVNFEFVAGADGIKVLKPFPCFLPKLFFYFLQSVEFPDKGYARHFQFLESSLINLPPFNEQARIVAKIEELFTKLDAGIDALRAIQKQIKRYRQAVLRDAVTGELTKAWREENQAELEPADALLKRILTERRDRWEQEQLKKFAESGKTPKNDDWKKKYKEPAAPSTENLSELPNNWIWASLDQCSYRITDGTHQPPTFTSEGIPFVFVKHIVKGKISFENTKFISAETYETLNKRCPVEKGDILYSAVGSFGVAVPVHIDKKFSFQRHIAHIKPSDFVNEYYIVHFLNSQIGYRQADSVAKGVAQRTVTLGDLTNFHFSLPPLAEQQKIVEEVERLLSVADAIEQTVKQSLRQAERLRQSILKRAFEGKLVPQDSSDEPAEILLERIKKEREEKDKQTKEQKVKARKPKTFTQNQSLF